LFWLIVTQGSKPDWPDETLKRKTAEVKKVARAYGMKEVFKLGLAAARLDTIPHLEMIRQMQDTVAEVKPETVYLVHGGDVHSDHRIVFNASMAVFKAFRMSQLGVRRVLCYETISSTDAAPAAQGSAFVPNVYCDITAHIDRKIDILSLYETEAQPDPLPRGPSAVRALARYRGATVGVEYAEAFMLMRELC
jgi:LmbE family N-acetylglucosaminyl deacetylase